MGLRITTNMASLGAQRNLATNSEKQSKHYQRLASGDRITSAGDDAAGLSISENMRGQIRSMRQAERNANDGISFVQVAEGALTEVSSMMIRMRELAIQAASDTVGDKERSFINEEFKQSLAEIDRIANVTTFNGTNLLNGKTPFVDEDGDPLEDKDGNPRNSLQFQVGIYNAQHDRINFDVTEYDVRTETLGVNGVNTLTTDAALESLDKLDAGLSRISGARARLGATQNKLQSTVNNIRVGTENLSAARSRIADTDVALETAELVRENILQSANISILAQANNAPLQALKLI